MKILCGQKLILNKDENESIQESNLSIERIGESLFPKHDTFIVWMPVGDYVQIIKELHTVIWN